ncbi:diacylglycerol kinase [Pelotomaculum propionicicum]|mgnify:CR=1 FL=1|uniref:Undecaprenol kinase n=1 Tax=Pelotomaculum propionicicum TaxID=258475 RepID=A0A4Y7RRS2_9FIRM|nr:diacylglycerol kinase [Pelotomaculum propionicicum]NLI11702.1 phosphatase PAP2 family protein [Peptococcaceae bacterium]TEB11541.1 Undecaprenol kinase [Pelotomaculum propionicicum]
MFLRKLLDGFNYAIAGIIYSIRTQRNMRIHFIAALLVLGLSIYLRLSSRELLIVFFTITLVIMAELFNTAIEAVVDLVVQEFHPLARIAKNVAAGAVLITALNSLVVAYIIIYPRLEGFSFYIGPRLKETPLNVTLLALLFVALLVGIGKALTGKGTFVKGGLPSGHTAVAFAGAAALTLLTSNALVSTVAFIMALLVAHSRLDTEVHTFFEVSTGALLGILATMAVFTLAGW